MLRVGLTGNIASGKSTVLDLFRSWGASVIDMDELAREATAPGSPVLEQLAAAFGRHLLLAGGALDRAALRHLVMDDPDRRDRLNRIIHPEIERRAGALAAEAERRGDPIVVFDIPLLFEVLDPARFDVVVLVDAPAPVRRDRLIRQRGLSPEDADILLRAQQPSDAKRAKSHIVIDNDGERERLEARAGAAWQKLVERARQFA